MLSFIVVDSRSDKHPEWVSECIKSIESQSVPVELIVVNNIGRNKTIGECFNEGVRESKGDWCVFVGDDDFVSHDYAKVLHDWINHATKNGGKIVNVATYMTAFEDESGKKTSLARQSTGAWKKDYLLKYPFNEKLLKGIDREYIEETIKRGYLALLIEYYFGYYYRRHKDYRCAGDIIFHEKPADYYFLTGHRIFLNPITERLAKEVKGENIFISPKVNNELMDKAKVIWVEWANERAVEVAQYKTDAKKILRLHAFEAFHDSIKYIDLNKFDTVIFIDEYIKDYVERQYGKVNGAVVIPNGVDLNKFTLDPNKKRNNKIAYAGYLTRKKGIGELILLAESLPEYEFYCAGRFQEDDIADYFQYKKPKNVHIQEWKYEDKMNEFYQDKAYVLNTSLRESQGMTIMEGMACGCKPIVRGWLGAEDVYPKEFIYNNINEFRKILEGEYEPEKYRELIKEKYDLDLIYPKLEQLFDLEVKV